MLIEEEKKEKTLRSEKTYTEQHTSSCRALICSQPIRKSQQHYSEEGV